MDDRHPTRDSEETVGSRHVDDASSAEEGPPEGEPSQRNDAGAALRPGPGAVATSRSGGARATGSSGTSGDAHHAQAEDPSAGGDDPDEGEAAEEAIEGKLVDELQQQLALSPEQSEVVARLLMATSNTSWSGALPAPDDFAQYDADVRERMMRWNDFSTVDESARQDRLVDAEIDQANKTSKRSFGFVGLCLLMAAGSVFWKENVPAAAVFLGAPVLLYAVNVIQTVSSRSSRGDNED